jgi:hypothetical protein
MNTDKDYLKWLAAGCALVATASAEYAIARACHFPEWVAWTVPGALDAYVLRALRAHREVLTAVLAMVGVNAASHLVTAGVLRVEWPLITAVSAIAPLVLWRVHALGTPGEWRARKIWDVPRASTPDEHDEHGRTEEEDERAYEHPGPYEPDEHASTWDEHADAAVSVAMPDYVPRDWSTPEWDGTVTVLASTPDEHTSTDKARVLSLVPPLPDGYVAAVLESGDMKHMNMARVLDSQAREHGGKGVPVRRLKTVLHVSTPRAQRIKAALDAEHAERTADTEGSTT